LMCLEDKETTSNDIVIVVLWAGEFLKTPMQCRCSPTKSFGFEKEGVNTRYGRWL
jgi:hypothetical protein